MSVKVLIPTPLRRLTNNEAEVDVDGTKVRDALNALEAKFPGFGERLFDDGGKLRRFINVFVNEEDIRFKGDMETAIKSGDVISIVPAVAGGC